jgi:mRNA interferase RelE/StbE
VKLRERIKRRLREFEESPERKGRRLYHSPFYRLRIGDYRTIYTINSEERKVTVLFIGHRRKVYDDFSKLF